MVLKLKYLAFGSSGLIGSDNVGFAVGDKVGRSVGAALGIFVGL